MTEQKDISITFDISNLINITKKEFSSEYDELSIGHFIVKNLGEEFQNYILIKYTNLVRQVSNTYKTILDSISKGKKEYKVSISENCYRDEKFKSLLENLLIKKNINVKFTSFYEEDYDDRGRGITYYYAECKCINNDSSMNGTIFKVNGL